MNGNFYNFAISPLEYFLLGHWRKELFSNINGNTLEIGFGTGVNFKYYPEHLTLTAIEPDSSMSIIIEEKFKNQFNLIEANVENMPFPDNFFDNVVITLVLCSVNEPAEAFSEINRVIKPGGKLYLLEHIKHTNKYLSHLQDALNPIWSQIAGGCNLNRNPDELIQRYSFEKKREQLFGNGIFKLWVLEKN